MLLYGAAEMTTRIRRSVMSRGQRRRHGASTRSTVPLAGPVADNSGRSSGNTPRRAIQRDEVTPLLRRTGSTAGPVLMLKITPLADGSVVA
jgi:hypothetical protein